MTLLNSKTKGEKIGIQCSIHTYKVAIAIYIMPTLSDFLGIPHMQIETPMIQFFTLTLINFGKHIFFLYVRSCEEGKPVIFRLTVHVIISHTVFCINKTKPY